MAEEKRRQKLNAELAEKQKRQKEERIKQAKIEKQKLASYKSNEKTKFLFEGSKGDILLLFDESNKSRNGIRNLAGDLVFKKKFAVICALPYSKIQPSIYDYVSFNLTRRGVDGRNLSKTPKRCKSIENNAADLVLLERGKFISQPVSHIFKVAQHVEAGRFSKYMLFDYAGHQNLLAARRQQSKDLLTSMEKGQSSGYGLLISKSGNKTDCSLKGEDPKIVKGIVSSLYESDPISLKGITDLKVSKDTLDGNFLKLKLDECKYFVARADKMKNLVLGLKRDKVSFSLHHELGGLSVAETKRPKQQSPKYERNVKRSSKWKVNKYAVAVIIGNKNYTDRTPQVEFFLLFRVHGRMIPIENRRRFNSSRFAN